jgi:hypothetical protein
MTTTKGTLEQEIEAMRQIASALEPLAHDARERVMKYVASQIGLAENLFTAGFRSDDEGAIDVDTVLPDDDDTAPENNAGRSVIDIRALVAEKRPKSAVEMATLVAYYLAELAPEKQASVNVGDLEKYFKQGAYPLPKVVRFTLTNAKDSGYLEAASRGQYKLTPVGHNLVAHDMPSETARRGAAKLRRPTSSATKKSAYGKRGNAKAKPTGKKAGTRKG